ncbi:MAG: hypothetical protein DIU71_10780 [Proteobacteria bacterium]|nr:MAG: hypothetical protein DIU71_10780 [Pseudomonadota bacterium]
MHHIAEAAGIRRDDLDHAIDHFARVQVPLGRLQEAAELLARAARRVMCREPSSQWKGASAMVSL